MVEDHSRGSGVLKERMTRISFMSKGTLVLA
jgi:hypothetical protein